MIRKCGLVLLLLSVHNVAPAQDPVELRAVRKAEHYAGIVESTNKLLIRYAELPPRRQKRLAFIAVPTARLRRSALKWLIRNDPESAVELSLSPANRQGLPAYLLALLETRIHATGDLEQSITEHLPLGDPQQNAPSPPETSWTAHTGQQSFEAFVYGIRSGHQTKYETPIHGIALDDLMAVDDDPLYELDDFELIQYGFQPGMFVALVGEIPIVFPDSFALAKQRQALIDQILLFGPRPLEVPPWTTGPKEILVIRADFTDSAGTPYSDANINAVVAETSTFFEENSKGQTSISATILPETLQLTAATTDYSSMGEDAAHKAIGIAAFRAAQAFDDDMGGTGLYDPGNYDRYLVLTPRVFAGDTGNGQISGKRVVIAGAGLDLETLAHELGHTWGFIHSSFWLVGFGASPIDAGGDHLEYGDVWDMMGQPGVGESDVMPQRRHFNAYFKWRAAWLPVTDFVDATPGGTYRLWSHDRDNSFLAVPGPRAIKIDAGDGTSYWLGARRLFESNTRMYQGIEVRRLITLPGGQLLDLLAMPPTVGTSIDHSLTTGPVAFEDTANGIVIRVTGSGIASEGFYADVEITRE